MKKGNNNGMGEGKQEQNKDNDITRIKGKGISEGIEKVKARSNGKTGVEAKALQWYNKFKKKCKGKSKWKEKGKSIEMGIGEERKNLENTFRKDSR